MPGQNSSDCCSTSRYMGSVGCVKLVAEGGAVDRHADRVGRLLDAAIPDVRRDPPLLQAVLRNDHRARCRIELPCRFQQHVAEEAVQVRLARQALEVAADDGVCFRQLRDALLRRALALPPHVVDEALPMEGRADDAGRVLERGKLGGIDRATLAGVVEADDADELAGDEDRYDGFRLGADALESRRPRRSRRAYRTC